MTYNAGFNSITSKCEVKVFTLNAHLLLNDQSGNSWKVDPGKPFIGEFNKHSVLELRSEASPNVLIDLLYIETSVQFFCN